MVLGMVLGACKRMKATGAFWRPRGCPHGYGSPPRGTVSRGTVSGATPPTTLSPPLLLAAVSNASVSEPLSSRDASGATGQNPASGAEFAALDFLHGELASMKCDDHHWRPGLDHRPGASHLVLGGIKTSMLSRAQGQMPLPCINHEEALPVAHPCVTTTCPAGSRPAVLSEAPLATQGDHHTWLQARRYR